VGSMDRETFASCCAFGLTPKGYGRNGIPPFVRLPSSFQYTSRSTREAWTTAGASRGADGALADTRGRVYEAQLTYQATVFEVGGTSLNKPELIYAYMKDVLEAHPMNEVFYVILLNRKNCPLGRIAVTIGTATCALAHPREVFRPAIVGGATAIICVHNHPPGDPAPSAPDISVKRILREAAKTVDIALLDQVILGRPECDPLGRGYFSFREACYP
jgi:DNA repair protein RadC